MSLRASDHTGVAIYRTSVSLRSPDARAGKLAPPWAIIVFALTRPVSARFSVSLRGWLRHPWQSVLPCDAKHRARLCLARIRILRLPLVAQNDTPLGCISIRPLRGHHHSAFCILHSAFCILHSLPRYLPNPLQFAILVKNPTFLEGTV